uniref:Parathyroid hormone n=1 Tax=Cyprinus carpio TaxID=7962 RepID=A0A8C1LSL2_CYPCA
MTSPSIMEIAHQFSGRGLVRIKRGRVAPTHKYNTEQHMDPLSTAATKYRSSQTKVNKTRLLYLEGLPLRRSISEVQLMHNVQEHKEMLERQDWLQLKLNNIIIPSLNDSQKGKTNGPSIRRLRKGEGAAWILN